MGKETATQGVHPHACGDTVTFGWKLAEWGGPPPRVWGYHGGFGPDEGQLGGVHPHACGDTDHTGLMLEREGGPPPRVWGYRTSMEPGPGTWGSTPTRVGIPSPG